MVWKTKGTDRGKSYKVYQELEARYNVLRREVDALHGELERKNATIRTLAQELAHYAQSERTAADETVTRTSALVQTLLDAAVEAPRLPVRTELGAFQRPLAKANAPRESGFPTAHSAIPPSGHQSGARSSRPMSDELEDYERGSQDQKQKGQR